MENELKENQEEIQEPEEYYSSIDAFLSYLESKQGNALANRILELVESLNRKKAELQEQTLKAQKTTGVHFQWIRAAVLLVCIGCVTALIWSGKFDSAPALFFGAIVAYFFGKEPK